MSYYNLIMVVTHQNNIYINKLIDTIQNNIYNVQVLLVIISQECRVNLVHNESLLKIIVINESKMGLSRARNIGLKYLLEHSISAQYIMFPDDDTSFDKSFFDNLRSILNSNKCFITPIYNEGTQKLYLGKKTYDDYIVKINDYKLIGSPNQIILYNDLKDEIYFNEDLGVGALYGSSEDLDLFLRLNRKGEIFYFTNKIYSYHPKKEAAYKDISIGLLINRFKNYSSGFAYIIFKYKLFVFIPEYLIRTVLAFVVFAVKFQFKLSLAYLIQFFIRIKLLVYFFFNREILYGNNK